MVTTNSIERLTETQASPTIREVQLVLEAINSTPLIDRLNTERLGRGPRGYPPRSMWRANIAMYVLNLPTMNALIRRLQDDLELRLLCGFGKIPHRTTFNRFNKNLSQHRELADTMLATITDRMKQLLPDFGKVVAVDSTVVRTYANANRKPVSDPDASWTAKNAANGKDGEKEWSFGYKLHAVADATHDIPISGFVTTAKRNDSPLLPQVLDKAASEHEWFRPDYVLADRGYDSLRNHKAVIERGGTPIIHIRNMKKSAKTVQDSYVDGVYTHEGVPTCLGMLPMEYVRSDPKRGHLYRCQGGDECRLKDRRGVVHCADEYWLNDEENSNPRLFGAVRRDSKEWKDLYAKRQSIERIFKSLKQSRRLETHCTRGLDRIAIHVALSVLVYQATALVHMQTGEPENLRWMVRRVA